MKKENLINYLDQNKIHYVFFNDSQTEKEDVVIFIPFDLIPSFVELLHENTFSDILATAFLKINCIAVMMSDILEYHGIDIHDVFLNYREKNYK